eukprot:7201100-Prymnesium_polylepis.1
MEKVLPKPDQEEPEGRRSARHVRSTTTRDLVDEHVDGATDEDLPTGQQVIQSAMEEARGYPVVLEGHKRRVLPKADLLHEGNACRCVLGRLCRGQPAQQELTSGVGAESAEPGRSEER